MEYQLVILDQNLNLVERGLVYADFNTATKEAAKFNKMFKNHCMTRLQALVQDFNR